MSKDPPARYYQKNKTRLQKTAIEGYQGLSEKEQNKKWENGHTWYYKFPDDKK